jgi:rhamnosyltransferase subunit B
MKNILLPTVGSAGDVHPFIALGLGLKARGLRPRLIANEHFRALITGQGLDFIPMGSETQYRQTIENPDLWHPTKGFQVLVDHSIGPYVQPLYEIIASFNPVDTVIVSAGVLYGARIAHEKLGMPWITVHLQPALFRTAYDTPPLGSTVFPPWLPRRAKWFLFRLMDKLLIDRAIGAKVNQVRQALGLRPQTGFFGDSYHAPQKSLGLFPDWFAPPQPDWPPQIQLTGFVRFDGGDEQARLDTELEAFLAEGEPPLAFTAGTAMEHGAEFFKVSLAAAQVLNRRALFLTRHREQLPATLPPGMVHVPYAPFSQLLPRVAALVHHGGTGTVAQALAAGTPQLIRPMAHDQPDNARRLEKLGVGLTLSPAAYQQKKVVATLNQILTDADVARSCAQWAQKVDFAAALQTACEAVASV